MMTMMTTVAMVTMIAMIAMRVTAFVRNREIKGKV
jgi:hypothetical protein